MSYIRAGSPYIYVEGNSDDYIFLSAGEKDFVEDYNHISDNTMVDLIARTLSDEDPMLKDYLFKKLAIRLGVHLRLKPLTKDEWFDELGKTIKDNEDAMVKLPKKIKGTSKIPIFKFKEKGEHE